MNVNTKLIKRLRCVFLTAVLMVSGIAAAPAVSAQEAGPSATTTAAPVLQIPVPTIQFSDATVSGEEGVQQKIDLPWIAQYVSGVYKYLVGIGGLVAAVMLMMGGFLYLTAADSSRTAKSKQMIVDAVTGLGLVLGAYLILNVVNPATTSELASLQVEYIKQIKYPDTLSTTFIDTSDPDAIPTVTAETGDPARPPSSSPAPGANPPPTSPPCPAPCGPSRPGSGGAPPGPHTSAVSSCPFTYTATTTNEKKMEFYQKMRDRSVVTGSTVRQRVVQIADLAVACQATLGSCGRTAATIWTLAGVGDSSCLESANANCSGAQNSGTQMNGISTQQRLQIYGLNCNYNPPPAEPRAGASTTARARYERALAANQALHSRYDRSDCAPNSAGARAKFKAYMEAEAAAGRLRDNWPDGWADKLQPGDYVIVYNGNADLVGAHAVIFMGWKNRNYADIVQGNAPPPFTTRSRNGLCLRAACGGLPIYTYRPER